MYLPSVYLLTYRPNTSLFIPSFPPFRINFSFLLLSAVNDDSSIATASPFHLTKYPLTPSLYSRTFPFPAILPLPSLLFRCLPFVPNLLPFLKTLFPLFFPVSSPSPKSSSHLSLFSLPIAFPFLHLLAFHPASPVSFPSFFLELLLSLPLP